MKKKLFLGANSGVFANAKALRYNMTTAENMLWSYLNLKVENAKFRRQHPLGNYIADFYCHKHKLVIDVDGGIHFLPEIIKNDIEKQAFFEEQGLKVIRFTNEQVFKI